MKFHYVAFRQASDGGAEEVVAYRPVVPIVFHGPRGAVRRLGLVDTGADSSLLPTWVADVVGISLDAGRATRVSGIGDSPLTPSQENLNWSFVAVLSHFVGGVLRISQTRIMCCSAIKAFWNSLSPALTGHSESSS